MEKLRDLMGRLRERKRQLLVVMMVVFASFGSAHAVLDNDSALYPLYTLVVDFAEIAPAIVTLILAFVVLIFVFIIVDFLTDMFAGISGTMGSRRRRGR